LERDFEQTIAYYALDGVARELIRTTSLLERTNRELRRTFGQVCGFGSPRGAEVAISVQVKRLNARWSKQTWWQVSHSLSFDFLNLDHSGRPPARSQGKSLTLFQRSPAEPSGRISTHSALQGGGSTGIGLARHPPHPLGCVHLPLRPFPLSQALP
jgi:hypothetical protein